MSDLESETPIRKMYRRACEAKRLLPVPNIPDTPEHDRYLHDALQCGMPTAEIAAWIKARVAKHERVQQELQRIYDDVGSPRGPQHINTRPQVPKQQSPTGDATPQPTPKQSKQKKVIARLLPTDDQEKRFEWIGGVVSIIAYNAALTHNKEIYAKTGLFATRYNILDHHVRATCPECNSDDVPKEAIQGVCNEVFRKVMTYNDRRHDPDASKRLPFPTERPWRRSGRYFCVGPRTKFDPVGRRVRIPNIGWVDVTGDDLPAEEVEVKRATIREDGTYWNVVLKMRD